jgi:hypothetical protein
MRRYSISVFILSVSLFLTACKGVQNIPVGMLTEAVEERARAVAATSPTPGPTPVIVESTSSQFVSQSIVTTMTAGQSYTASIIMTNNGTRTWTPTAYYLGSENLRENTVWGMSRVFFGGAVPAGSSVAFNFSVTAPATPGVYNFQWRMVDGTDSFGDFTPNQAIQVVAQ